MVFKLKPERDEEEATRARKKGTLSTLWDQGGGWELFLKIWEKIMRFVEENPRITII